MKTHSCDAVVVSCIDFRFQKFIRNWLDKNFGNKTYDFVGYAGSTKDLELIMNQIDISVRLHDIKEVYLIHHENCGAYGDRSTPEVHREDLLKAKKAISNKYPYLKIDLFYLLLNGDFVTVE